MKTLLIVILGAITLASHSRLAQAEEHPYQIGEKVIGIGEGCVQRPSIDCPMAKTVRCTVTAPTSSGDAGTFDLSTCQAALWYNEMYAFYPALEKPNRPTVFHESGCNQKFGLCVGDYVSYTSRRASKIIGIDFRGNLLVAINSTDVENRYDERQIGDFGLLTEETFAWTYKDYVTDQRVPMVDKVVLSGCLDKDGERLCVGDIVMYSDEKMLPPASTEDQLWDGLHGHGEVFKAVLAGFTAKTKRLYFNDEEARLVEIKSGTSVPFKYFKSKKSYCALYPSSGKAMCE